MIKSSDIYTCVWKLEDYYVSRKFNDVPNLVPSIPTFPPHFAIISKFHDKGIEKVQLVKKSLVTTREEKPNNINLENRNQPIEN